MADEETIEVRVVDGRSMSHRGERYAAGDTFEMPADLAARHPNTVVPTDSDGSDEGGGESDDDTPLDPSEFTVDALEAELNERDLDAGALDAIEDAEREGKNRDGAFDAIEAARADE